MDRLKRRLFFWTLVIAFFVVAPIIVLHARGYRFNWSKGVFVYSGTITFKANPETVSVSLNGQPAEAKQLGKINNSWNLTGLIPRDYELSVSAPGYHGWSKKTDVHSGLSSEFWNVVLTRTEYSRNALDGTDGAERFYVSPKNDYMATVTEGDGQGFAIGILNLSSRKIEKTYQIPDGTFSGSEIDENVEWSPNNDYLAVPVKRTVATGKSASAKAKKASGTEDRETETEYGYYVIDLSNGDISYLNDAVGKKSISHVRWDPKSKGYLFFMEGGSLFRSGIKDSSETGLVSEDVSAFDLSQSDLYYVQVSNDLVFRSGLALGSARSQMTWSFPEDGAAIRKLIIYDDDRISFLSDKGDLFAYNRGEHDTYFKKLGSGVSDSRFSDDGKKLLFWTPNEISVYYVRDWLVQPTRDENAMENVTRYAEPIRNVQWYKDYEHVIFTTDKYAKFVELDPRDHRNCLDLIDTKSSDAFLIYNGSLERLYYSDKDDSGKSSLSYIVFPEPVAFLGIGGNNGQQ